jgi:hypothetical protein
MGASLGFFGPYLPQLPQAGRSIQGSYSSRNQNDIIPCLGRGSKNENEKNLEILVCVKHAETEKHLTPKSIQPESILPPLIGHCQQLI